MLRHLLHILISVAMWCLFGYYWYIVSGREIGPTTLRAVGILSLIIVVGLVITFWWVSHNMRLARRNRRKAAPPSRPETFDRDYLDRPVVAPDIQLLQRAQVVDVELTPSDDQEGMDDGPDRKVYSIATEAAS